MNNEILERLLSIERFRERFSGVKIPLSLSNRLRKSSKKKSTYASNRIEGNPLSEAQVGEVLDSARRHFLKPEQKVRNYFDALTFLESKLEDKTPFSMKLILDVQAIVVKGESSEKTGLRGPMPPGVLFAVYDDVTGEAEYIPPMFSEVEALLAELVEYVNRSDDHPILKAATVHYQMVTIHPFEDGNGRTARLMSDYLLDLNGYGFNQIGSLEEYFAYDIDEYYASIQMGLPPLYYDGRENPPHPEIWYMYFLRMMELHAKKVVELAMATKTENAEPGLSYLNQKERSFLRQLVREKIAEFSPKEMSDKLGVTNRTVINWCLKLVKTGFLLPLGEGRRIRGYALTELAQGIGPDE